MTRHSRVVRRVSVALAVVAIGATAIVSVAARRPEVAPAAPAEPVASAELVDRLLASDRWIEALEQARRAAEDRPDDPLAAALVAATQLRAGRLTEVERSLGPALAVEQPSARALCTLARLRRAEGRVPEAVEAMSAALALEPHSREILYWASEVMPDRRDALSLIRRYLEVSEGDDPERVEAARGAARVFEALGETVVWFDRERPEQLDVPLQRLWDPTNGVVQGYVIRPRVGGGRKRVPLLLDSGSPGLYVIDRVSKRREFVTLAERTVFGGGGDGRHATRRGLFPSFSLQGLVFGNALATSTPDELDPLGRYHGLVGLNIFGGYRVTLDLGAGRLALDRISSGAAGHPYWTIGGQMLVEVDVGPDEGPMERALFLFDTGATRTLVSNRLAERVSGAAVGETVELHGFGGRREARTLAGVRLRFAGVETPPGSLRAVDLSRRSRLGGVEVSGFLGLDLLDRARLVIDTVQRRVELQPSTDRGRRTR